MTFHKGRKEMNRKRVTIIGWHNNKNTGDDSMLQVIVWLLLKKYPKLAVYLLTTKENIPSYRNFDVKYIPLLSSNDFLNRIYKAIMPYRIGLFSSLLLFGGGSIFHSANSIKWKKKILDVFYTINKRGIAGAIGISIGPFTDSKAKSDWIKMMNSLSFVVTRDSRSFQISERYNINKTVKNLLVPDLAFLLPDTIKNSLVSKIKLRNRIGISITKHINSSENNLFTIKNFAEVIIRISIERQVEEIALFTFSMDNTFGDQDVICELFKYINPFISVVIIPYCQNPIDMLNEFCTCRFVICMRYHSQIFASIARIPFITIAYHEKNADFLNDHFGDKLPIILLDELNGNKLLEKINKLSLSNIPSINFSETKIKRILTLF